MAMKWYSSLITKITIIFALAIMGIGTVLYFVHVHKEKSDLVSLYRLSKVALQNAHHGTSVDLLKLQEAGFTLVVDENLKQSVLNRRRKFLKPPKHVRNFHKSSRVKFRVVKYERDFFIVTKKGLVFYAPYEAGLFPKVIFPLSAILLIIFLYIATIRSILPLYSLRRKIKAFADGDYDIECRSEKKDEIGVLCNELDKSVKKIKKLRDSRQLFLRNIMHELKTPITKGRISTEMIESSKHKDRLISVFKKLEELINEFVSIEQITSGSGIQNVRPARLVEIIDEAISIAMVPVKSVKLDIDSSLVLSVDFRLFTTAIKNLIDNGIKYSTDSSIIITATRDRVSFISRGIQLIHKLEHYIQPFTQEKNSHQSFGLGLYIVDCIAKAHNLELKYYHKNGLNYFNFEKIENLL